MFNASQPDKQGVRTMALASLKKVEESCNQDDKVAYKANLEAFKGGQTREEILQYYDCWADRDDGYDKHLNPDRYTGPEYCAKAVARFMDDNQRQHHRILDVAAGTGRVGVELHKLGFRNIDGLDPSKGMLNKARSHGVYKTLYQAYMDVNTPVPVQDGAYDGLTVCGGFGEGHIPISALQEITRIVRKGGILCFVLREEYLEYVDEYKGKLLPMFEQFQQNGVWRREAKDTITKYFCGKSGTVFVFRLL